MTELLGAMALVLTPGDMAALAQASDWSMMDSD